MQMHSSALRGAQDFPQRGEGLREFGLRVGMVVEELV